MITHHADLVSALRGRSPAGVCSTPSHAHALAGTHALAVCVGTAITRPTSPTRWFVESIGAR